MVVVTSTTSSKAINTLVGISARVPSSRDKIELEEVEGALIEHLPLINLREKGLEVLLAPFLPLNRYSMNKVISYVHQCDSNQHLTILGTMFGCVYSSSWSELDHP